MQTPTGELATLVVTGAPHLSLAEAVDAALAGQLDLDVVRLAFESVADGAQPKRV